MCFHFQLYVIGSKFLSLEENKHVLIKAKFCVFFH